MKKVMTLMALATTLSACDYLERRDSAAEQDDRTYRAAMDDYRAGRLDAAARGFEKAVERNPANASARFQLACLLQDVKHDAAGAFCEYREYLRQHPASDKARLAKERLALCEKDLAKVLADRYSLVGASAAEADGGMLSELKAAKDRAQAAEKALSEAQRRVQALADERDRLLAMVREEADADTAATSSAPPPMEVKELLDEKDDEMPTSSALLLVRTATSEPVTPSAAEKEKPKAPAHPATYAVEDGDTLYAIAKRFYGNIAAWKAIRDANKALISTDGRVRAGDVLTLPDWP